MALCKTALTLLLIHWSYCSLALSHRHHPVTGLVQSSLRPDIINYNALEPAEHIANLNNAFYVAEEKLGITRLLDAEGKGYRCVHLWNIYQEL